MRTFVLGLIVENVVGESMWQHDYSFCWLIKVMGILLIAQPWLKTKYHVCSFEALEIVEGL